MKSEENNVAQDVVVRRAKLADSEAIATLVNVARSARSASRAMAQASSAMGTLPAFSQRDVAERFGQVGFMIAERERHLVGLLGWQVENLVVRVIDFLIASGDDPAEVGQALVEKMEAEAAQLLAEAVVLFLPTNASDRLVAFWQGLGYQFQSITDLHKVWREAVTEQGPAAERVMIKRLRRDLVRQPV